MSVAFVRIGGYPIDQYGRVSDLQETTIWRTGAYSGLLDMSFTWTAPREFAAPWFRRGARVEIVEHGIPRSAGLLSAPTPGDPWSLEVYGLGEELQQQFVVEGSEVVSVADVEGRRPNPFLVRNGVAIEPPEYYQRTWIVHPGIANLGTDESAYVSGVYIYYVSSINAAGEPDGWTLSPPAVDEVLEAKFGPRRRTVDATSLGRISASTAGVLAQERLDAGGRRLGWTGEIELMPGMLTSASGALASPLSVRAGDRLMLPGFTDSRSQASYSSTLTITAGEVTRYYGERRCVVKPMGAKSEDLESIFASIAAPESSKSVVTL